MICVGAQVRAKAIRKYVDKMIQLAKDGSLHARRQVRGILGGCARPSTVRRKAHVAAPVAARPQRSAVLRVPDRCRVHGVLAAG